MNPGCPADLGEGDADEVLAAVGEQRLGGGIRVGHVEVLVEHQHGGG